MLTAYALCLVAPTVGLQHFYLGRDAHGVLHLLTLGGVGLGWARDLCCLPRYVATANEEPSYVVALKAEQRAQSRPSIAIVSSRSACHTLPGSSARPHDSCTNSSTHLTRVHEHAQPSASHASAPQRVCMHACSVSWHARASVCVCRPCTLCVLRPSLCARVCSSVLEQPSR
jgi:hypothetical protein